MSKYSDEDLHQMAELYLQECGDVAPDFIELAAASPTWAGFSQDPTHVCSVDPDGGLQSRDLPKPSREMRRFLCNDQCPKQCATLHCPWNSMRNDAYVNPLDTVTIFGTDCTCKSSSCLHCVQERSLRKFRDCPSRVACSRWTTLHDPPPFGFSLYAGVGEPVSDSFAMKHTSRLYRLECVPWKLDRAMVRKPAGMDRMSFLDLS